MGSLAKMKSIAVGSGLAAGMLAVNSCIANQPCLSLSSSRPREVALSL